MSSFYVKKKFRTSSRFFYILETAVKWLPLHVARQNFNYITRKTSSICIYVAIIQERSLFNRRQCIPRIRWIPKLRQEWRSSIFVLLFANLVLFYHYSCSCFFLLLSSFWTVAYSDLSGVFFFCKCSFSSMKWRNKFYRANNIFLELFHVRWQLP